MARFAANTTVSVSKSQSEIENILRRYGATGFVSGWDRERAFVAFSKDNRNVKFILRLPSPQAEEFTRSRRGKRQPEIILKMWEQSCRQLWRALSLVIKAKLEAVAAGITVFEDEFLAHIILPDGSSVGEHARKSIAIAYDSGKMPPLLPYYGVK